MESLYEQLALPEERRKTSLQREQAEFIFDFLRSRPITSTLETGLAFGCSTVHIMKATTAPHIAIDPYQKGYHDVGLETVARFGLQDRFRHIALPSHAALPQLLADGVRIDFGLIDGGHKFDEMFVDWYYIGLLLNRGGHILFDDAWLEATQMVASFVRNNRPDFREVHPSAPNMILFEKIDDDHSEWTEFRTFSAGPESR
jgi:predicted O-methyltransferase YrrM